MIKLSPYHEVFYNEWKLHPQRSDYNIVSDNELFGSFDPMRLRLALQRLSDEYFLLQSRVIETDKGYFWVPRAEPSIAFDYVETPEHERTLLAYVKTPFDLGAGPLLRIRLVKLGDKHFRLVIVAHHLIMDGGKVDFIFENLSLYYNNPTHRFNLSVTEQCRKLEELSRNFEEQLTIDDSNHIEFWRTQLTDLSGPDLRFLKATSHTILDPDENNVGEYLFSFNEDTLRQLQQAARKNSITPFILSQIIFSILLHRHTGQEKLGITFPFSINEGAEFIYGVHINPVVIPYQFDPTASLKTIIDSTRAYFKSVKKGSHHYFPLQKLLLTFTSKETVTIAFTQTNLKNRHFHFNGITNEKVNTSLNIDLAGRLLFAQEIKDKQVFYRVLYKREDIDADLLLTFVQTYQRLLHEILDDLLNERDHRPINEYSLLEPEQYQLLAEKWNQTDCPYPTEKTLHQLFEEQVLKTPDAIAVIYKDVRLTYATLNQQANQLAHYIKEHIQICPDDLIALCVHPSDQMIVALLGALKAGAAYVPIDPAYPDQRIVHILKDAQVKLLLADHILFKRLTPLCHAQSIPLLAINNPSAWSNYPVTNLNQHIQSHHLAYVIYTSGSTGHPKGVLIEHRSTVNYVTYLIRHNQLSSNSVGAKYASFSFDASVIEIYPILFSGGKLCVLNEADRLDCGKVNDFFEQHNVTYAFLPTSFAELFCELKNSSLRNLIIGGNKLRKIKYPSHYRITNAYGPTEATVQATAFVIQNNRYPVPIGKPIQNIKCYVLDINLNLLPIGAIGALWIGGAGLARGYLNKPNLTTKKFITNPFQTLQEKDQQQNNRLYNTGDLVRWSPDGNLEYIGRNDNQIKIRGYRIELAEIENQLLQYPGIQHTFVTTADKPTAETALIAYYAAANTFDESKISAYLAKYLPEFMVPVAYTHLLKWPINVNGKFDKSLLPEPLFPMARNFVPANTELEKTVCTTYAQILGLPENQVGIYDSFFQLGGNSISAIRLAHQLSQYFTILVTDIFKLETPANIIQGLPLLPNRLDQKIQKIRLLYANTNFFLNDWEQTTNNPDLIQRYKQHLAQVHNLSPDVYSKKKINSLLLTGVTGHLGCHLLEKLLTETPYIVYLPIRAISDHAAYLRIKQKFQFYFDKNLDEYHNRIIVFAAHLEQENLGLSSLAYQALILQVDSVIHCASLVKYYGNYDEFYRSNVQTTANLLKFTQQTQQRDFHYISTLGVLMDGYIQGKNYHIFTEDEQLKQFIPGKHPYIRSKYAAEQLVIKAKNEGISGTIYRVGNLAMHSASYRIQEDYEKNFFFSHIRAMVKFGIVPAEVSQMEVSPVDYTAVAILKIFDKLNLSNQVYHVFNPNVCNLRQILEDFEVADLWSDDFELFAKKILSSIEFSHAPSDASHLLMLYQFWLQEIDTPHSTNIRISAEKTKLILTALGFNWPTITNEMFADFIKKAVVH